MKKLLLVLLLSTVAVFADNVPEVLVKSRFDFSIPVTASGAIQVKRGEHFIGKIYANKAEIRIRGIWYDVSRNQVTTIGVDPNAPVTP
jgi:hypothetical protein